MIIMETETKANGIEREELKKKSKIVSPKDRGKHKYERKKPLGRERKRERELKNLKQTINK